MLLPKQPSIPLIYLGLENGAFETDDDDDDDDYSVITVIFQWTPECYNDYRGSGVFIEMKSLAVPMTSDPFTLNAYFYLPKNLEMNHKIILDPLRKVYRC